MAEELVTTCPFCGQKFTGPGNSTRGYWEANGKTKEEDAKLGETFRCCIQTTQDGHLASNEVWGIVTDGFLTFNLPPFSSIVLSNAVIEGSEN